ncbi:MAG: CoA-binding protein, partial [Betaproteobacteria bacterium]|nr:CoA-binding protein [Betaproteobacteria bacterium]
MTNHYLSPLFTPRSVAIVGATERDGALGRFVWENMRAANFQGTLYAVNPKHRQLFGNPCYARLSALPTVPDLIVITAPAEAVLEILRDAGQCGIKAAVVLSAGFAEIGPEGRALAESVKAELSRTGIRMIGPNCLGIMRPAIGLNATFANVAGRPGSLALVSQSGAVCTAILDWAATTEIGFSSLISLGGAIDLDFGEVLDYLVHDPETRGILLYIEGIRDARRFLSSLRAAARVKPVIVLKAG